MNIKNEATVTAHNLQREAALAAILKECAWLALGYTLSFFIVNSDLLYCRRQVSGKFIAQGSAFGKVLKSHWSSFCIDAHDSVCHIRYISKVYFTGLYEDYLKERFSTVNWLAMPYVGLCLIKNHSFSKRLPPQ